MDFEFYTASKIVFGKGSFEKIKTIAPQYGHDYLVVCGGSSMERSGVLSRLERQFRDQGVGFHYYKGVVEEPGPDTVEKGFDIALENQCDAVIAIGGGSVIDTGKAIAALITNGGPLTDYLEGVGNGRKVIKDPVPFIAVPTTSGTGSEVTKNAVITSSEAKYKKSFRSEKLIPKVALVDPELTVTLPPFQTATSGMDALTQLIESYVSKKAKPIPEVLALYGIELAGQCLLKAYQNGSDIDAREGMAMASLLSGVCLANSGLGAAHGIAAALGCHYGVPHGLACAVLLPHVMEFNLESNIYKFANIGRLLTKQDIKDDREAALASINCVKELSKNLNIPSTLRGFAIKEGDLPVLAKDSRGSSMSGNPLEMTDQDIINLLRKLI